MIKFDSKLQRIVIGVDPPGGSTECGIVTVGVGPCRCQGHEDTHGFVIADDSLKAPPDVWGERIGAIIVEYAKQFAAKPDD